MTVSGETVRQLVTGVMMNYYHICHTELWFFAHNIVMEHGSDIVALGKLTHEEHYTSDTSKDEFMLEGIKLDRVTADGLVHEVKKSDRAENAHIWQLRHHLWRLNQAGFGQLKGILEFPKQRKRPAGFLRQRDNVKPGRRCNFTGASATTRSFVMHLFRDCYRGE